MKILIDDGFQLNVGTGIGQYTKMLIEDLKKYISIVDVTKYSNISKLNNNLRRLIYLIYINTIRKIDEKKYDVIHYTNYVVPFVKSKKCMTVVTIHDLVAYKYPETLPKFYRIYNRVMIKNSLKKAHKILTVSESVKEEIREFFPDYVDKVEVTYIGVNNKINKMEKEEIKADMINDKIGRIIQSKFFLFVGTIEKRKNVDFIVKSFIKAKEEYCSMKVFKLVLAGRPGYGYEDIESIVNETKYKDDIIVTGYISDYELSCLYNTCEAYIFASKYEGFGIPQIECMKCETPIILSNIPTNLEISRDYGEFFNLKDIESLSSKFGFFSQGKYDHKLKNKIAKNEIKRFDRDKIIKNIIEIYTDGKLKKER